MVRAPYFDKNGTKKGAWSEEEDKKLSAYVDKYGHPNWRQLPKFAGFIIRTFFIHDFLILVYCLLFLLCNRVAKMWKKLQTSMDELPAPKSKTRELYPQGRPNHLGFASKAWKQVGLLLLLLIFKVTILSSFFFFTLLKILPTNIRIRPQLQL